MHDRAATGCWASVCDVGQGSTHHRQQRLGQDHPWLADSQAKQEALVWLVPQELLVAATVPVKVMVTAVLTLPWVELAVVGKQQRVAVACPGPLPCSPRRVLLALCLGRLRGPRCLLCASRWRCLGWTTVTSGCLLALDRGRPDRGL